jgi:hypothetical protein
MIEPFYESVAKDADSTFKASEVNYLEGNSDPERSQT